MLAGVAEITFVNRKPEKSIGTVGNGFEAFLLVDESINKESLAARFEKSIETENNLIQRSEAKLSGKFIEHAPAELIDAEKKKLEESRRRKEKLESYIRSL